MVSIRTMELCDVVAVAAIEAEVSTDGWSADLFAGEFAVDPAGRHWLVATVDPVTVDPATGGSGGEGARIVIGFIGLMIVGDEAHVMNLAVAARVHRRGVARSLLYRAVGDLCDRGVAAMTLEVRASNRAALALYRSLGFQAEGRRPLYYPDGEDAVIMWIRNLFTWHRRRCSTLEVPAS